MKYATAATSASFTVKAQWLNFGLFAALLVLGLGVVGWMVRSVVSGTETHAAGA